MDNTIFKNIAKRSLDFDRFRHYDLLVFQKKFLYGTKYLPIVEQLPNTELRKVICTKFYSKSKILPIFTDFGQFSTFYEIVCDVITQIINFRKNFSAILIPYIQSFFVPNFMSKHQPSLEILKGVQRPPGQQHTPESLGQIGLNKPFDF